MTPMVARLKQKKLEKLQAKQEQQQRRARADAARAAQFAPVWAAYQEVQHLHIRGHPVSACTRVWRTEAQEPYGLCINGGGYINGGGVFAAESTSKGISNGNHPLITTAEETVEALLDFLLHEGVMLPERGGDDPGQV